jgi:type II secretory pathway pseudopilin PulG
VTVRTMGRKRPIFSLVELTVVMLIIGFLVVAALPRYGAAKQDAYVARMLDDLRNLATSQEAYFSEHSRYFDGDFPLAMRVYSPAAGVRVVIHQASATGWSATASTNGSTRECTIYMGTAAPVGPATVDGSAACR